MNSKSLQKEIARHFSVTWRAARRDPGAFSAAFLLSSFFLSSLFLSDLLLLFCGSNSSPKLRRSTRKTQVSSFYGMKKKKKSGFIVLGIESATAGCGIPCDSMAGIFHAIKIQSTGSLFVIVAAHETLWQTKRKLSTWLFFILASKFIPHPSVSQRNFSVMRSVQHKSTETMMKKKFPCWHMGTGRQAYHKPWQARREEKKGRKKEKKDVGSSCL